MQGYYSPLVFQGVVRIGCNIPPLTDLRFAVWNTYMDGVRFVPPTPMAPFRTVLSGGARVCQCEQSSFVGRPEPGLRVDLPCLHGPV